MKIDKKFLAPFYPFAGFCVAWYCLMPNFTLLFSGGMYRSQLLIHANFLYKDARYLWKKTTQPKTTKWNQCSLDAGWEYFDLDKKGKTTEGMMEYKIKKCGEKPEKGT
tara:strand:- start:115 stop:438 length:324 start_codon:yes stop_codon:yes gene_type:complete